MRPVLLWARLQGFPDTFILPLSDTHLYKQFGNSVTVPVIEAIAKEIRKVLKSKEQLEELEDCFSEDIEIIKRIDAEADMAASQTEGMAKA